jgi:hypothetical protein
MAATATNIIAGPATLWRAAFGATEPLDTAVASAIGAPFEDMGGTDDGVTLNAETEWFRKRMDQTLMAPGSVPTSLEMSVATNLTEGTLENLAAYFNIAEADIDSGGTGGTAWRALDVGNMNPGDEPAYSAIIMRGRGVGNGGKMRNFILRKCLSIESLEAAYKKDDQWLLPVTFGLHWVSESIAPMRIVDDASV